MMQEKKFTIAVPRGAGVDGMMTAIRKVLSLSRLQSLAVDQNGRVSYVRFLREDEPEDKLDLQEEFDRLMPSKIIQHIPLKELFEDASAANTIAKMIYAVTVDSLEPLAFALHPRSGFWKWHQVSTGIDISQKEESIYGIPTRFDEDIPLETLVLLAGYSREASLIDARRGFKVVMPIQGEP